jgi:hypothetical protein
MPEVDTVEIDFDKKTATVTTKAGQTLSRERVAQVLQPTGKYGVTDFTEKPASGS